MLQYPTDSMDTGNKARKLLELMLNIKTMYEEALHLDDDDARLTATRHFSKAHDSIADALAKLVNEIRPHGTYSGPDTVNAHHEDIVAPDATHSISATNGTISIERLHVPASSMFFTGQTSDDSLMKIISSIGQIPRGSTGGSTAAMEKKYGPEHRL